MAGIGTDRTASRLPALTAAAPDHLTWNHGMLDMDMGATGDSVVAAYRLLDEHGLHPYMDVFLWSDRTGDSPSNRWPCGGR